jgi:uncharacterized protein
MTGELSHITVSYRDKGAEITQIYAINDEISRELSRQNLSGRNLQEWLEDKGCQLDSPNGPASVIAAYGMTVQEYYRNGKLHRDDGPAHILRALDGSTKEEYYSDGKHVKMPVKPNGPKGPGPGPM